MRKSENIYTNNFVQSCIIYLCYRSDTIILFVQGCFTNCICARYAMHAEETFLNFGGSGVVGGSGVARLSLFHIRFQLFPFCAYRGKRSLELGRVMWQYLILIQSHSLRPECIVVWRGILTHAPSNSINARWLAINKSST